MDIQSASTALSQDLAARMELIGRISVTAKNGRQSRRHQHLDEAMEKARTAIVSGEVSSLQAALWSIDLISFELCDD